MIINAHEKLGKYSQFLNQALSANPSIAAATRNMEISFGPSSDSRFGVDAGALDAPAFVGDSRYIGAVYDPQNLREAAEKGDANVRFLNKHNPQTGKFDVYLVDAKNPRMVSDAAPNLIAAQLLTPNLVNNIIKVFHKPLVKSNARKMVTIETGDNPWADVQNFYLADYAGFAVMPTAGSAGNNMSQDIEVGSGIMSNAVINMDVTWKLTVEEIERNKATGSGVPYAGQLMAAKQRYADWCLDTLTDAMVYFGNTSTGTVGLLNSVSVTSWTSVSGNHSMKYMRDTSTSTAKGSDVYKMVSNAVAQFLTDNQNMVNKVRIAVSPEAYNIAASLPYSDVYHPEGVWKILKENFAAGENTEGVTADIEVYVDPLLSASTLFNSNSYDYMVITSPEIGGGPDYVNQGLVYAGMPLDKFTYPVIAGQYATPYKTLRRYSGLFVPYTPAINVYSGFGTPSA